MRINDKDVFLMSNSEPKLKGGYITPYAVDLIENYMLEYWNNKYRDDGSSSSSGERRNSAQYVHLGDLDDVLEA